MSKSELDMAAEQFHHDLIEVLNFQGKDRSWADIQSKLEDLVLLAKHCRQLEDGQRSLTQPDPDPGPLPKVEVAEPVTDF